MTDRFASVDAPTPLPPATPSTIAPSETFSPAPRFSSVPPLPSRTTTANADITQQTDQAPYSTIDNNAMHTQQMDEQQQQQQQLMYDLYTHTNTQPQKQNRNQNQNQLTTTSPGPGSQSPDAVLQAAFAQMLQSPGQMQRLLAALAAQSLNPMPEPPPPPLHHPHQQEEGQLLHYGPPVDYARGGAFGGAGAGFHHHQQQQQQQQQQAMSVPVPVISPTLLHQPLDLDLSGGGVESDLAEDATRLQKTYRDAAEIEDDVNALHTSINSLIESLGLDPNAIESAPNGQHQHQHQLQHHQVVDPQDTVISSGGDLGGGAGDTSTQDFDFDQFLTDLTRHGDEEATEEDYTHFADTLDPSGVRTTTTNDGVNDSMNNPSPEQLTAFLDEVQSPSDGTVSPVVATFRNDSPEFQPKRGSKRKSDIAGISSADEQHHTARRSNKQQASAASQIGTKLKRKR
jgi:hypothetical protein